MRPSVFRSDSRLSEDRGSSYVDFTKPIHDRATTVVLRYNQVDSNPSAVAESVVLLGPGLGSSKRFVLGNTAETHGADLLSREFSVGGLPHRPQRPSEQAQFTGGGRAAT